MDAFDFRKLCADVTHPRPSQEGSFEMLLFYLIMNDLWRGCFPSREGSKGCVTVRVAAWVEGLRDTVSRRLVLQGVIRQASGDRFDFRKLCADVTHPRPLSRGEVCSAAFFLVMSDLCVVFPSREGIKGCVTVKVAAWAEVLRDTVSRRLVLQGVICRLRVAALVFGGSAQA